ncbi:VanW family protein [Deinococcus pimensis]|uniref:VanW family protein n=1 Tax=Deinococcus pimensis TaxID=309888 RepID=UPI0004B15E9E|nr:VanW family protein [Deinococcus pimensis]
MTRHALLSLLVALSASAALAAPPVTPVAPPPSPTPATAPATKASPISVVLTETVVTVEDGRKVYTPVMRSLDLGQERSDALRARGVMTTSLRADVERFAASLARPATDTRFEYAPLAGEWQITMRQGVTVDLPATLAAVEAALKDPRSRNVNVAASFTRPSRTPDFFLNRGITAMLGEGSTNYLGSSAARATNIHVGTRNFQDRLFEGETFSFNDAVGPVTTANGYVTGLVIAGDQTASGVGGGICQVSTTVFRALYAAGLPVVQRQNHSYQVHWYDPQGLDATIYQPTLDLKFRNDTGGAIWTQADWDDRLGVLNVRAFGRPRAETVEISTPKVLASTPAPPARFIQDPTLAPGRRVQVDWAAPGATIEVERVLRRDGKVVRRDTLRSVYRPWPNIYRVGPDVPADAKR